MKFDVYKKINLGFLGEGWEGCDITFTAITVGEARDFAKLAQSAESVKEILDVLKEKFVSGKALSEGKIVELKKNDLENLPLVVYSEIISVLTEIDIKKK